MRHLTVAASALLLFALSTGAALASEVDQVSVACAAPEVPASLLYPASGLIAFGLFKANSIINRRKH
jgi:hypothetical protein